jgi:hypothetical protein
MDAPVALNVFLGEDPSNWGCVLKVADVSKDEWVEVLDSFLNVSQTP